MYMKHFKINNYNLALLQEKSKLYGYLNGKLDKVCFKLDGTDFVVALNSGDGEVLTNLEVEYENGSTPDTTALYFSTDYQKWATTLQKFNGAECLHISLGESLMRVKIDGSQDVINLSLIYYDDCSQQADAITRFIAARRDEIKGFNHKLVLTPEILADFDLMGNLFTTQGRINAIGVSSTDVMYSDRSVVVKANLDEELPAELFDSLPDDDNHIQIHSFTLKLLDILSEFNKEAWFDSDYEVLYWADEHTELVLSSEAKVLALPTAEQLEGIKPINKDTYFDVNIDTLREGLAFFTGFYDGDIWKPVTFTLNKGEDVVLRYQKPSADLTKVLEGVESPFNCTFSVDSETLRKILQKIKDRYPNEELVVRFNCDDDTVPSEDEAPGVYCTVGNTYEFNICKLRDD